MKKELMDRDAIFGWSAFLCRFLPAFVACCEVRIHAKARSREGLADLP